MADLSFTMGDAVNYAWTPRGGYGLTQTLAGQIVGLRGARVSIMLAVKDANGEWQPYIRHVAYSKLTLRTTPCEALDAINRRIEANRHKDERPT